MGINASNRGLIFALVAIALLPYNLATMTTSKTSSAFATTEEILVTKEGLKKIKEELELLKGSKRIEIAARLKEAISYGDLSENAEYEEAKNEQAFIEGRILELEKQVKLARIITEHDSKKSAKSSTIEIGSVITVRNKTDGDEPETYTIVGSMEANPIEHKISNESPIGKALLGHGKGDIVDVVAPAGKFKYEVLKVA
jgi:transcription elongation factor GreA